MQPIPASRLARTFHTDETADETLPDLPTLGTGTLSAASAATPVRERSHFLWTQQRYILENIKLADTKAGFVITLASAGLSVLFSHGHQFAQPVVQPPGLAIAFSALAILALLGAIFLGAWSIKPRVAANSTAGPVSWTEIARYPNLAAFQQDSRALTEHDAVEGLAEQVFHLARICFRKHQLISRSILLAVAGGLCLVLDLITLHLYGM